jgi:cell division protein FtsQ
MKTKKPSVRRKIFVYIFWFLLITSALVYIINLPIWKVQLIEVTGTQILDADQIRVFSQIPYGENIFLMDLHKARKSLSLLPQVKESRISKLLPSQIEIKIKERVPFAIVSCPDRTMLIDEDGYNLSYSGPKNNLLLSLPDTSKMPVISGLKLEYFENQLKLKGEYLRVVQESIQKLSIDFPYHSLHLSFDESKNIALLIDDVLLVKLGEPKDLSKKMAIFRVLYRNLTAQGKKISYLDLRFPENPVVKL